MADLEKLRSVLARAEAALAEARLILAAGENQAKTQTTSRPQNTVTAPVATPVSSPIPPETPALTDAGSFEYLSQIVRTDQWPDAVNTSLICDPNSEEDKLERGRGIIELMIEEDLKGLRFLDYGCGEGHCPYLATEYGAEVSIGFDIKPHANWTRFSAERQVFFTTDYKAVQERAPYRVIMLFDVLDHLKGEDAVNVLKKVGAVLADNGKIYARMHPFTSRHATHLYHDLNKAFLQLVFTPEELRRLVPEPKYEEHNNGVLFPLRTYTEWINLAGLKLLEKREVTERPEQFFQTPAIAQRILQNTKMGQFPNFQMSLSFCDLVLGK